MAEVGFNYEGLKISIQCKENEIMKNICQRFLNKIKEDKNNKYFSYNGNAGDKFDENLTFEQMINSEDKKRNKMNVLVFKNEVEEGINEIVKSKDAICPLCGESVRVDLNDYKITLNKCKNKHKINNLLLNEFEISQKINNKKIKCGICKNNDKSNSYNKIFYKCYKCEKNICPLCKVNHDKTHKLINYDDKFYVCRKHYENYNSYCEDCEINLCTLCEGDHKNHNKIYFGDMMLNKDELIKKKNNLKKNIDIFIGEIKIIINILKEVIYKMNLCYKINEDIINNYNIKNRNYELLYTLNKINENNIEKELENIIKSDIKTKFNSIFDIYTKMNFDEINIIYKVKEDDNEIKMFDSDFVERNKNKCKIICDGIEEELKEKKEIYTSWFGTRIDKLEIKLKGILNITDMHDMFSGCSSLKSLPDISKWNISNATNLSGMFSECISLSSLPNISRWNISNVTNISYMFRGCASFSSLPDISKWNTSNVTNMMGLFYGCSLLLSLPDISKWNTSKVIYMNGMFRECSNLSSLPDISKWNTSSVINMSGMFYECSSLSSIPDISKWNISSITNMMGLFYGCSSLLNIPDISKWNISKITNMSFMFYECSSLSSLPDISKWDISNNIDMISMFEGCNKSLIIPSKFKKYI